MKIKCAVYRNNREWEGGLYYFPEKNHKQFALYFGGLHPTPKGKKEDIEFKGIFEFDIDFLDNVIGENVRKMFIEGHENLGQYWDGTWCI